MCGGNVKNVRRHMFLDQRSLIADFQSEIILLAIEDRRCQISDFCVTFHIVFTIYPDESFFSKTRRGFLNNGLDQFLPRPSPQDVVILSGHQ